MISSLRRDEVCTVLCGIPCTARSVRGMFLGRTPESFASEWVAGNPGIPEDRLEEIYLSDLPQAWSKAAQSLEAMNVRTVADAKSQHVAQSLAESEVTIIVAHHVIGDDMSSIGLELCDGILLTTSINKIAPINQGAIVDLCVCRSANFIPLMKSRCSAVRVIARQLRVDPVAFLRLLPDTVHVWRHSSNDYIDAVVNTRLAMLNQLGVGDQTGIR